MITTYKKMATLAVTIGQPTTSQKYLNIAQELLEKTMEHRADDEPETEEEKK
jgi:hypothetical protein